MCFPTEVSEAVVSSSFPRLSVLRHKIQAVTCLLPDAGYHIICNTGEKYAQNHRFLRTSVTYSRNNTPGVHHTEAVTAGCDVCSHMLTAWTAVPQAVHYWTQPVCPLTKSYFMVCVWRNYSMKSHHPTFVSCLKSVRPEDNSLAVTSHYDNQYSLTKA